MKNASMLYINIYMSRSIGKPTTWTDVIIC